MIGILASLALAKAAPVECAAVEVWATVPPPLAMDVPIDAVPAGLLSGGNCGGTVTARLSVTDPAVLVHEVTDEAGAAVIEVDPEADLLPGRIYALRFDTDDGSGAFTEIGFTTGSGRVVGLEGAPEVSSAAVNIDAAGRAHVQGEVKVAGAAEGDSIVTLGVEGEGGTVDATLSAAGTILLGGFTQLHEIPEEVCVVARQRDLAGNWTDSAPNCVVPSVDAPGKTGGCGARDREDDVPMATGSAAALGLLFFGFSRRRRADRRA